MGGASIDQGITTNTFVGVREVLYRNGYDDSAHNFTYNVWRAVRPPTAVIAQQFSMHTVGFLELTLEPAQWVVSAYLITLLSFNHRKLISIMFF